MAILSRLCSLSLTLIVATPSLVAQNWSIDELRRRSQGFHEASLIARMQQMGSLIDQQAQMISAFCTVVHGDHREYLLKIERLLDQLANDRWFVREEAERNLIETGARAIALIENRAKDGVTLEERIRSQRIQRRIAERGTEDEDRETRLLRGWVATAAYLPPSKDLTRALLSAVGHADPAVQIGAVRALGVVGGESAAGNVHRILTENQQSQRLRNAALMALVRMPGHEAITVIGELFAAQNLSMSESVSVVRVLKERKDSRAILDQIASADVGVLAKCAKLKIPSAGTPLLCKPSLPNGVQLERPFLGVGGDYLRIADLAQGIAHGELLISDCDSVTFAHPIMPSEKGGLRLFLGQGSLITGKQLVMKQDLLSIVSPVFGRVEVPRAELQGLALDPKLDRLIGASATYDRVRLGDGSFLDGDVLSISANEVSIDLSDGAQRTIAIDQVAAILFKRPPLAVSDSNTYTRIDLVSGDRLLIHLAFATPTHLGVVSSLLGESVLAIDSVARIVFGVGGGALWGFTLIADYSENQILEVDEQGNVVWSLDEVFGCWDAECLDNGNLLITEYALNRVMEVSREGKEIWVFEDLKNPNDADRLPNGNTLIADTYGARVIEVNRSGEIIWQYAETIKPFDVERLANGNTLIADDRKDRVIEVDPSGRIVWKLEDLASVHDADRLPNGNTLITLRMDNKVIEVDPMGNIVFTIEALDSPSDADRLPNGNTLVAESNKVREFDRQGKVVWERRVMWAVEINRY